MKKNLFKILCACFFLVSFTRIITINLPWIYTSIGPDFTQVWISAKDMAASREPYLDPGLAYPNAYPPVSVLFFLPLTPLSHQMALVIFTYISFASVIGSVFLSIKIAMKKVPWHYFLLFIGLTFSSFPTRFTLGMGQVNMIVLFFLLLGIYFETIAKKNSIAAGISLGIAIALKPIFSFFLLFLAIKKTWKAVFTAGFTVVLLVSLTLIFWSPHIWVTWYQSGILPLTNYTSTQIYVYQNQGIYGFLLRLIPDLYTKIFIHKLTTLILVPIAIYMAYKKKDYNLGISFFIITLLLFDITSWQHHFVWLMFPFIVLLTNVIKSKKLTLLILLLISYVLVSWNIKYDYLYPKIILSIQLYGNLILYGLCFYFFRAHNDNVKETNQKSLQYKLFELLKME